MRKQTYDLMEKLQGILFPDRCIFCGSLTGQMHSLCCKKCKDKLKRIEQPFCYRCGKAMWDEEQEYCSDCRKRIHKFRQGRSLWVYDTRVKRSLYQFKYQNKKVNAKFYGNQLDQTMGKQVRLWDIEGIIPVPIHRKKYKKRGYNQAQILAEELGKLWNLPVLTDVIIRQKNTIPQKELSTNERYNNLRNSFKLTKNRINLKRILLVDDIYTTGATVDAVSTELLKSDIEEIYVLTVASGMVN